MTDWLTPLAYALPAIVGTLSGVLLGTVGWWARSRFNLNDMRKLSYGDIIRIFSKLYSLRRMILLEIRSGSLEKDEFATVMFGLYHSYLETIMDDAWYKSLRAKPYVFSRFSDGEQKAVNAIYELQSLTINERIYDASIEVFRKIPKLKDRIIAQKDGISNVIDELEELIRTGLNEDLLFKVSTQRDKWYVAWIFHRQEINDMFANAEKSGILSAAERHAHPDFLTNIGEQFANKSFGKKQKLVLSQCWNCKHYKNDKCAAFPTGIPKEILANRFLHQKEHPGDHGVRYDPIDNESIHFTETKPGAKKQVEKQEEKEGAPDR